MLNGERTKEVLSLRGKGGSSVKLSAEGTSDPDGNSIRVSWWIYPEAGTLKTGVRLSKTEGLATEVFLQEVRQAGTVHVILQVEDDGTPHLWAYRRAVIQVTP
jgi:hypothetical protein